MATPSRSAVVELGAAPTAALSESAAFLDHGGDRRSADFKGPRGSLKIEDLARKAGSQCAVKRAKRVMEQAPELMPAIDKKPRGISRLRERPTLSISAQTGRGNRGVG